MENEFDMNAAVGAVGEGFSASMGFEAEAAGNDVIDGQISEVADATPQTHEPEPSAAVASPAPATSTEPAPATSAAPIATAPRTWRTEAAAQFATLPPVVQAEIAKREEDMFKGIESYKGMATIGKTYSDAVKPYEQVMRQVGADPVETVKGLMQSHYTLAFGTAHEKATLMHKIAADYGIDLGAVQEQVQYQDPQVQSLREELNQLRSSHQQLATAENTRSQQQLNGMIREFASDAKNVHFKEVISDMVTLLQAGAEPDLASAYQTAVWRNPVTRAKEIERTNAANAAEAAAKAKAEVEKAKKTMAGNVKPGARSGSAATPSGSIEDTMRETLARMREQ